MEGCIFCKIVKGDIPCMKVAELAGAVAFLDINPLTHRGHTLVIPKAHAQFAHDVDGDALADCGRLIGLVGKRLVKHGLCADYNVLQNNGALAHQEVPHVHFHIIPKTSDADGLGIDWRVQPIDKATLAALHAKLAQ